MKKQLMLGNEAIARGAFEAGCKVISSYPGTPSTEITEYAATYDEMYSEWAPNEKVAFEVAIGASIAGARAMTAMKHVGLNVAADPLFTASYIGVNGGLVICVADDPGMHSSQNEQDSRHYAIGSKVLMLEPSDSSECLEFVKEAFNISEAYDTPVIIRLTTRVSHSHSMVELSERENIPLVQYTKNISKYVMVPAMAQKRHVIVEERMALLKGFSENSNLNKIEQSSSDNKNKIGVITSGISYQYAKEALGDSVSYLKLGVVYPLPDAIIKTFAQTVSECYVIEELDPIIQNHCKALGISVHGKECFTPGVIGIGEYSAEIIRNAILGEKTEYIAKEESIPNRPPVMCAGCSHRSIFHVLGKLKLIVSGDIGCYALGAMPPLSALDTCVCMGASVSMLHGMDKADENITKRAVAVIGDSTFIHSGITGLIDIVYNKGNSTIIILDNSITGMTGHQDNPTTGKTIKGITTKQVDLKKLCEAVGVERVFVIDPFDVDALTELIKNETSVNEPSVIIAQRPCALIKKANYTGKCSIKQSECKKCFQCLKIGCPAINKVDNELLINKAICVGCGYCNNICRFGAIGRDDVK